ncbi:MAG TPA: Ldh family oxidoreductase [Burkholderiales bacterium]|nr:Ldh family oxidoreductase [Burkholderiales bacterium]
MSRQPRYSAAALIEYATELLDRAGLEQDKSAAVAEVLVEGDLLGHDTHGLHLLAPYLKEIESGKMTRAGEPRVIADFPAALTWDGMRLPGPWLVLRAIEIATRRAKTQGTCTVAIRRSHHIACLSAYLKRVADEGLVIMLLSSGPETGGVAPHGGRRDVYTPDPIAAAWPTAGDPVLIDVSMSITTHGLTRRLHAEKNKLPGRWLIDGHGNPSDDPAVLFADPPGALLPLGGLEHGHKGYALGLLVEALTQGLSGHGRADPNEGWAANVYVQIFDPRLYGGEKDFVRQTQWLADACRDTPPRPGFDRVRLPGEAGLARRRRQLAEGVELYPSILPALAPWAEKLGVQAPAALP